MSDYYSESQEHSKLVQGMIEASLRRDKQRKPQRPKPETPYKGSWADEMEQRRNGTWQGEPLVKPRNHDSGWITLKS